MKKIALIAGASGALGSEILKNLCTSEHYNKVIALARHELEFTHEKLEVKVINFDELKDEVPFIADDVFCALGTTMKVAKHKEQFYKVDVTYPLNFAKFGLECGAKRFVLLLSLIHICVSRVINLGVSVFLSLLFVAVNALEMSAFIYSLKLPSPFSSRLSA